MQDDPTITGTFFQPNKENGSAKVKHHDTYIYTCFRIPCIAYAAQAAGSVASIALSDEVED